MPEAASERRDLGKTPGGSGEIVYEFPDYNSDGSKKYSTGSASNFGGFAGTSCGNVVVNPSFDTVKSGSNLMSPLEKWINGDAFSQASIQPAYHAVDGYSDKW